MPFLKLCYVHICIAVIDWHVWHCCNLPLAMRPEGYFVRRPVQPDTVQPKQCCRGNKFLRVERSLRFAAALNGRLQKHTSTTGPQLHRSDAEFATVFTTRSFLLFATRNCSACKLRIFTVKPLMHAAICSIHSSIRLAGRVFC